jgi:hypothetical protein
MQYYCAFVANLLIDSAVMHTSLFVWVKFERLNVLLLAPEDTHTTTLNKIIIGAVNSLAHVRLLSSVLFVLYLLLRRYAAWCSL